MEVKVKVPGSCGEFIQGYLNGENFLISSPVDIYSTAYVRKTEKHSQILINDNKQKTYLAVQKTLSYCNKEHVGLNLKIESDIPYAKGMSSSTADITAAVIATLLLFNKKVEIEFVKKIALEVEPSDATFMKGIVLFDHINGHINQYLGEIDQLPVLIFDYGGEIETLSFNARKDLATLNSQKSNYIKKALKLIKRGIKTKNYKMLGRGATISSLANQSIINKQDLKSLISILKKQSGFLGLITAHSGTIIGVILKEERFGEEIASVISANFPFLDLLFKSRLINGGYEVL
ncbi:MAG: kinase [Halanaerobiales bacterium]|nr:kinase [Halanaerobiales bacterium]